MADFDIAIIGGGLNGTSLARDAAGRGLSVVLMEQNDLGGGAAAASPHLLHGDFIGLEHGSALRVRRALTERGIALRSAPHIVRPTRFVLPVHAEGRPPAMLKAALYVYGLLTSDKTLPGPETRDLTVHDMGHPLKRAFGIAFEYPDCTVDESRLVVLNARDAADRGAHILTGARCARGDRSDIWKLAVIDRGHRRIVTARALVNATGAWSERVSGNVLHLPGVAAALSRVSQIVVRRLFDHDNVYVFQNTDRRLVYAIPYQQDFTLIGAVSRELSGDPNVVSTSAADVTYLCHAVNRYLREGIEPADVIHAMCAPHVDLSNMNSSPPDGAMRLDWQRGEAPLLTMIGGATTTARRRAELAMKRLTPFFAKKPAWTASSPLPGGDFASRGFDELMENALQRWPFLTRRHAERMAASYGTRMGTILGEAKSMDDLGPLFGENLTGAEVRYLMTQEWARFADDVLWRRSKLGLAMPAKDKQALDEFMASAGRETAMPS